MSYSALPSIRQTTTVEITSSVDAPTKTPISTFSYAQSSSNVYFSPGPMSPFFAGGGSTSSSTGATSYSMGSQSSSQPVSQTRASSFSTSPTSSSAYSIVSSTPSK